MPETTPFVATIVYSIEQKLIIQAVRALILHNVENWQNVVKYLIRRSIYRTLRSSLLIRLIRIIAPLFIIWYLPCQTINAADDSYYTWIDENGVTNFAQKDPKEYVSTHITGNQRFGRLNAPKSPKKTKQQESSAAAAEQEVDPDLEIQSEREDVKKEIAKIRASNCSIGKRNLAKLEAYARIRIRGKDGEERVITEEEKQDRTAKARTTITENCVKG